MTISQAIIYLIGFLSAIFFGFGMWYWGNNRILAIWFLYGCTISAVSVAFMYWHNETYQQNVAGNETKEESPVHSSPPVGKHNPERKYIMTFEEFEKQADATITAVIKEMTIALNASSIKIDTRKIEIDDSINFILFGIFNLPDKMKMEYVHLNIKYPYPEKISFRGNYFQCPDKLDSLFQMVKEHKPRLFE